MQDVSTFRLHLLRFGYLLIAAGLAIMIWPRLLAAPADLEHMRGVTWSLLAGVSLLALVGIRYPLRMLPLLLFELIWKTMWLVAIGIPAWSGGRLTPDMRDTVFDCIFGIAVVVLIVPWSHVVAAWVRLPGDRWRGRAAVAGDSAV